MLSRRHKPAHSCVWCVWFHDNSNTTSCGTVNGYIQVWSDGIGIVHWFIALLERMENEHCWFWHLNGVKCSVNWEREHNNCHYVDKIPILRKLVYRYLYCVWSPKISGVWINAIGTSKLVNGRTSVKTVRHLSM